VESPPVAGVDSVRGGYATEGGGLVKGAQKPKKVAKKQAQKTLKERRQAKRDATRPPKFEL
jgi:hypothetical protein